MGLELQMGMLLKGYMWDFQHSGQGKCKKIKACCQPLMHHYHLALSTLFQHQQLPSRFLFPWQTYPLYEVVGKVQWSE